MWNINLSLKIAEKLKKPTLCLYRPSEGKRLSAMIKGNKMFDCSEYNKIAEVKLYIDKFLNKLI